MNSIDTSISTLWNAALDKEGEISPVIPYYVIDDQGKIPHHTGDTRTHGQLCLKLVLTQLPF